MGKGYERGCAGENEWQRNTGSNKNWRHLLLSYLHCKIIFYFITIYYYCCYYDYYSSITISLLLFHSICMTFHCNETFGAYLCFFSSHDIVSFLGGKGYLQGGPTWVEGKFHINSVSSQQIPFTSWKNFLIKCSYLYTTNLKCVVQFDFFFSQPLNV